MQAAYILNACTIKLVDMIVTSIWNMEYREHDRSGEVTDVLERRKVKACCVQETRWKGEGTRILRTKTGGKYKLFWKGCSEGVSGVGMIVSEEFIDKVVEVTRVSERLMMIKLIVGKCLMNVVAACAPQTGRSQEEKDNFWEAVWKLIEGIKKTERIMLGGDLNRRVMDMKGYIVGKDIE